MNKRKFIRLIIRLLQTRIHHLHVNRCSERNNKRTKMCRVRLGCRGHEDLSYTAQPVKHYRLLRKICFLSEAQNQAHTRQQTYANSSPSINTLFMVSSKRFPI